MKEWYQSKTFYFNLITIALGVIEIVTKTYPIDPNLLVLIMGIGNLVLRVLTGEKLAFGGRTFGR